MRNDKTLGRKEEKNLFSFVLTPRLSRGAKWQAHQTFKAGSRNV